MPGLMGLQLVVTRFLGFDTEATSVRLSNLMNEVTTLLRALESDHLPIVDVLIMIWFGVFRAGHCPLNVADL